MACRRCSKERRGIGEEKFVNFNAQTFYNGFLGASIEGMAKRIGEMEPAIAEINENVKTLRAHITHMDEQHRQQMCYQLYLENALKTMFKRLKMITETVNEFEISRPYYVLYLPEIHGNCLCDMCGKRYDNWE